MADTAPCDICPTDLVVIGQSLCERVLFSQAQGILVGLTCCSPDRAAHALLSAARDLGITVGEVARQLTRCMATDDDRFGPMMARVAAATLGPEPAGIPDHTIWLDAQPEAPEHAEALESRARPDVPVQGSEAKRGSLAT
jgi:hypothetical protein